ncbi:hypothetical protein RCC89_10685 [Cytophagaceae bacterium ABcell3]|nr:hypothetical protein RCC89_10685 [Cytophagaceae bacterium ABcell3]
MITRLLFLLAIALPATLTACPPEAKTRLAYHLSFAKQLYENKGHSFHVVLPLATYENNYSSQLDFSHLNNPVAHYRIEKKDFYATAGVVVPALFLGNERDYNYSLQFAGSAGYAYDIGKFTFRPGAEFMNTRHDMFFGDFTALSIPPTWAAEENFKINVITNFMVRRKTFSNIDPHQKDRHHTDLNLRVALEAKIRQVSVVANSIISLQREETLSTPNQTFSLGLVYNL